MTDKETIDLLRKDVAFLKDEFHKAEKSSLKWYNKYIKSISTKNDAYNAALAGDLAKVIEILGPEQE